MNQPLPVARTTSGLAIASLVLGVLAWCMLPFVGAVAAVVCGHLARSEIRRTPPGSVDGGGLAVVGLVLGYLQLALTAIGLFLLIAFVVLGLGIGAQYLPWH
jgi:hypothetical protein